MNLIYGDVDSYYLYPFCYKTMLNDNVVITLVRHAFSLPKEFFLGFNIKKILDIIKIYGEKLSYEFWDNLNEK